MLYQLQMLLRVEWDQRTMYSEMELVKVEVIVR
jgi:hypothetical protein